MNHSFPQCLFALLSAAALLLAGCAETQPPPAAPPPAPSSASSSASSSAEVTPEQDTPEQNVVGQTETPADPEGQGMPLDRDVRLLESPEPPVPSDARSSAAFARAAAAHSSPGTSVENVPAKVEALLSEMTLEEKVGQMTQLTLGTISREPHEDTPTEARQHHLDPQKLRDVLVAHHVGSILNVDGQAFTLDHWHDVLRRVQQVATEETRLGIPVLYGIDAVHGANYTQEATLFPQNQGLAATWNPALAQETAAITARDVRASGIPWDFAPVLGLGREPRWARLYETLGEDAHLATTMGLALLRGYQGTDVAATDRVAATLKHYVGYSVPKTGMDRTPAQIPEMELREQFLRPFAAAIDAGAKSIMINSGEVNGVPAHASKYLLEDLLRDEMGFEGVAVSDWSDIKKLVSVHRVAATEREATKMAVMAGVDMSMVPTDLSFYDHLLSLAQDGEVPTGRIDEAVRRILTLKFELGLFDDPLRGIEQAGEVGSAHDRRVSLQAARESVTLLRNRDADGGGALLPLGESQRVLVTGPTAHSMQALHNGWSYTWQGQGVAQGMFPEGRPTLMEALRKKAGPERLTYVPGATLTAPDRMAQAVAAAREADVAVVALGEGAYAETPGDIQDMVLPEAQRELLRRVAATGTPVVLVLLEGRPRIIGDAEEGADAVLAAYNPGPEGGQALMEVLYGTVNPSGHLPFTYPRSPGGMVTYDRKYSENQDTQGGMSGFDPLFAFGSGRSYTTFEYSDLEARPSVSGARDLQDGGEVEVGVTVTNTGERRGKDVVQLYLSDLAASVTPSVKKLKRFAKVDLAPGESTRLSFALSAEDFSFIGRQGVPVVEPGAFRVQVDDMQEEIEVEGERFSPAAAAGPPPAHHEPVLEQTQPQGRKR